MATFIGIDLGTTYSCIAQCDEIGIPTVIPCQAYSVGMATPSVITFMEDGKPIIGDEAKSYMTTPEYASRTLSFIKRYMGQDYCPEKIVIGGKGSTQKRNVSPVEGSACILHGLFNEAQKSVFGSQSLQGAVITIPAGYTEKQRACVKKAAQLAGINVLGLIHEPTAAAICHEIKSGETILVFDLGGGTLDVSIVTKKQDNYKVLAVSSDSEILEHNLGGKDWDEALMKIACQKIGGYNPDTEYEKGELKIEAEKCKKRLTRANETQFFLPKNKGNVLITRSDFQKATKELVNQCLKVVDECIARADREASNGQVIINRFIMVGGSSNMPMIQKALERKYGERFSNGRETERWLSVSNDAETSISKGAALYARHLINNPDTESEGVLIEERSIHSYGTSVGVDRICNLIKSTDSMVFEKTFSFKTMEDGQKGVLVDLFENESIEDEINRDGKAPIYDEKYIFDWHAPKDAEVEFKVNRDRDGLIRITVSSKYGHTQTFSHATSVMSSSSSSVPSNGKQVSHAVKNVISAEVEKQIRRSIELMQEEDKTVDDDDELF